MAERKFANLRRRLDQLGYRQSLGIESVPLVEKLFSDLIHTTESLKTCKLQLNRQDTSRNVSEDSTEPYRNDNAKLVRENNELHLELIKQKEESDGKIKDLRDKVRQLEHENADLKFLNSQYVHKVRALEKDLQSRTDKIHELQEKNLQAVVETPGGRSKKIPARRQRMDIEKLVKPSVSDASSISREPEDPYVADLLKVADEKIENLESRIQSLNDAQKAVERRNKSLRKQVIIVLATCKR